MMFFFNLAKAVKIRKAILKLFWLFLKPSDNECSIFIFENRIFFSVLIIFFGHFRNSVFDQDTKVKPTASAKNSTKSKKLFTKKEDFLKYDEKSLKSMGVLVQKRSYKKVE